MSRARKNLRGPTVQADLTIELRRMVPVPPDPARHSLGGETSETYAHRTVRVGLWIDEHALLSIYGHRAAHRRSGKATACDGSVVVRVLSVEPDVPVAKRS